MTQSFHEAGEIEATEPFDLTHPENQAERRIVVRHSFETLKGDGSDAGSSFCELLFSSFEEQRKIPVPSFSRSF